MTQEFSTSLVREKIVLVDDGLSDGTDSQEPIVIRSNRIFLRLTQGKTVEKVVIRAQNMHTTLRLAGKMLFSHYRMGSFLGRENPYDWQVQWDSVLSAYEKEYNPNIWAAIYINGKPVFKTTTSPFVDVIEQCALLTIDNYDATMEVTETALKQVGKAMRINHSSNVAAVINDGDDTIRCGIIHRADGRDSTFSFTATGGEAHNRIVQTIGVAAAFLEAFNLSFTVRALKAKLRRGEVPKISPENNQMRAATGRQVALNKSISSFEEIYAVKYRPEKPDFFSEK